MTLIQDFYYCIPAFVQIFWHCIFPFFFIIILGGIVSTIIELVKRWRR